MTSNEIKIDLGETTREESEARFVLRDEKQVAENMNYVIRTIKAWKLEPGNTRKIYFTMRSKRCVNEPADEFFDHIMNTLTEQKYYCSKTPVGQEPRFFHVSLDPLPKE